jgi:hypothetical protein
LRHCIVLVNNDLAGLIRTRSSHLQALAGLHAAL